MKLVVHCKKEPYDIYVGRPSKWGNPFRIGKDGTREEVIKKRNYALGVTMFKPYTNPHDKAIWGRWVEWTRKNFSLFLEPWSLEHGFLTC